MIPRCELDEYCGSKAKEYDDEQSTIKYKEYLNSLLSEDFKNGVQITEHDF